MSFKPLMPRSVDRNMANITFEEYKNKKYAKNPLVATIVKMAPGTGKEIKLGEKLQFYIDTVTDMTTHKNEIETLWSLCNSIIKKKKNFNLNELNNIFVYPLMSITGEAHFENERKNKIDAALSDAMKVYFENLFNSDLSIVFKIREVIFWYNYHLEYLRYLLLGLPYSRVSELKYLIEQNDERIESLKTLSPGTFIGLIEIFKHSYAAIPLDYRSKFRDFYLNSVLQQIIVSRNYGYFDSYERLLEDYYSEKFRNKKNLNWVFKNLIGYGEKPWRLVGIFFIVNLVFAILFVTFDFDFKLPEGISGFSKFVAFLSFNNTSMLTVGYGDIYPVGIGARFLVILLQITGFVISASAVTLFVRKILRF